MRATGKTGIALVGCVAGVMVVWYLWPDGSPVTASSTPADTTSEAVADTRAWPDFDALLGDENAPATPPPGSDSGDVDATGTPAALRGPALVEATLSRLSFDDRGRLVVDKATGKAIQDAFAQLARPLTDAELDGVERMIRRRLEGDTADRVVNLVRDFHAYRQALEARARNSDGAASPRARFDERVALRREYLGEDVATRFYADQEAYQRFVLERQRIAGRTDLSRAQRVALQTALQDDLLRGVMHLHERDSAAARELRAEMRALRGQGASQEFLDFVRTQAQGLAAAAHGIEDGEPRAAWERQVALYRSERRAILNAGLTEAERRRQLEALLDRYFGARVQRLVEAYRAD